MTKGFARDWVSDKTLQLFLPVCGVCVEFGVSIEKVNKRTQQKQTGIGNPQRHKVACCHALLFPRTSRLPALPCLPSSGAAGGGGAGRCS